MHEINIVPYVDVMLVLLVIFMVTAPLITPSVIDLPTVSKAGQPKVVPLEVFVKADKGLVVRSRDRSGAIISETRSSRCAARTRISRCWSAATRTRATKRCCR
jgi:biopolymer transport protein TolR